MAGALTAGPPSGSGGSYMTNLASNRGLQGETVAASGRIGHAARHHDHLLVSAIVLSAPATTAGALLAGPPPDPDGSNETNLGPNRACTK
ncbi:hypothetical protein F511_23247 [Dorcoceras hygrometricum]|uniref:Uncharacterized protein n=1 Tax=Dorcoceras hygrometricum TaxID=472368 RepID=A0A2Z7BVM6_9LAMI|nr:hypothetical protein F511_23247 [Dorcoceras hygrometricum]